MKPQNAPNDANDIAAGACELRATAAGPLLRKFLWLRNISADPELHPKALAVALVLADVASNDSERAWPARATIAKRLSCSERAVDAALASLTQGGWVTPVGGYTGPGHSRRWALNLEHAQEAARVCHQVRQAAKASRPRKTPARQHAQVSAEHAQEAAREHAQEAAAYPARIESTRTLPPEGPSGGQNRVAETPPGGNRGALGPRPDELLEQALVRRRWTPEAAFRLIIAAGDANDPDHARSAQLCAEAAAAAQIPWPPSQSSGATA